MGRREHPSSSSIHRARRQTERHPALDAGYLLWAVLTMKWTSLQTERRLLVHARGLGHRSFIRVLRPARLRRDRVMFEVSRPTRRRPILENDSDHAVTVFYTAPTAIRSLIKAG